VDGRLPLQGGDGPARWLTWANGLTLMRLAAAPACACALLSGSTLSAFALFWLAVGSDLADGRVARRFGEASPLGGLLDHATDATFVTLGTLALAITGSVAPLLPVLIPAAFLQYVFDSNALRGRPLRTSALGRWNGIAYFVVLGTPIVRDALGLGWPSDELVLILSWALVVSTAISMTDRLVALLKGS